MHTPLTRLLTLATLIIIPLGLFSVTPAHATVTVQNCTSWQTTPDCTGGMWGAWGTGKRTYAGFDEMKCTQDATVRKNIPTQCTQFEYDSTAPSSSATALISPTLNITSECPTDTSTLDFTLGGKLYNECGSENRTAEVWCPKPSTKPAGVAYTQTSGTGLTRTWWGMFGADDTKCP